MSHIGPNVLYHACYWCLQSSTYHMLLPYLIRDDHTLLHSNAIWFLPRTISPKNQRHVQRFSSTLYLYLWSSTKLKKHWKCEITQEIWKLREEKMDHKYNRKICKISRLLFPLIVALGILKSFTNHHVGLQFCKRLSPLSWQIGVPARGSLL
jgi:hypothetical protein